MKKNKIYDWLFSSLDDIIDCEYEPNWEDEENVNIKGNRPFETINDSGKSRRDHQK